MEELLFYSERAPYYDELFKVSPWKRLYLMKTASFIRNYRPPEGGRILDAGGGTGLLSLPLALKGYDVTIIDSSPGMLNMLREKVEALSLEKRVTIIEDDIIRIANYERNAFDLSLCCQVLSFVGDKAEYILNELATVTDGYVVADADTRYYWTMMEAMKGYPSNAMNILREGRDEVGRAVGGSEYRLFEYDEIKGILEDQHYRIDDIRPLGFFAGFLHVQAQSKNFLEADSLPVGPRRYLRESAFERLVELEDCMAQRKEFRASSQWIQFAYRRTARY